jgi:hypothetical protein
VPEKNVLAILRTGAKRTPAPLHDMRAISDYSHPRIEAGKHSDFRWVVLDNQEPPALTSFRLGF